MQSTAQMLPSMPEYAGFDIRPLHALFGAELQGLQVDGISQLAFRGVQAALDRYCVTLVRGANCDDSQHIAFSRNLGPLQLAPSVDGGKSRPRLQYPELWDVSNLDEHGELLSMTDLRRLYAKGNAFWHTDGSFKQQRPAYSLLRACEVSPGGSRTELVDMRVAYESLSPSLHRAIEGLVVEHSIWHSRELGGFPPPTEEMRRQRPPARHRLVQVHAGSGRKTLYLAAHATSVVGWPLEEGRALLAELMEASTRPELVYSHDWALGDLLIWDNRCTMHRVKALPTSDPMQRRDLRRTTVHEVATS